MGQQIQFLGASLIFLGAKSTFRVPNTVPFRRCVPISNLLALRLHRKRSLKSITATLQSQVWKNQQDMSTFQVPQRPSLSNFQAPGPDVQAHVVHGTQRRQNTMDYKTDFCMNLLGYKSSTLPSTKQYFVIKNYNTQLLMWNAGC